MEDEHPEENVLAPVLARLGRTAALRRGATLVVWVLVLLASLAGALTLSGPTSNTFTIPGSESSEALVRLGEEFPEAGRTGPSARVVFASETGSGLSDALAPEVLEVVEDLNAIPGVRATSPLDPQAPSVTPDNQVGISYIDFELNDEGVVEEETREAVLDVVERADVDGFITVVAGGEGLVGVPEVLGAGELVGVALAFGVLLVTYGSLVAAGANLLTALVGVGVGAAGITALTGLTDLQSTTPILAVMLGLAVGIDYALFIFTRFRSELRDGRDVIDAVGRTVGTAGSAVVFAGLTVVVALVGLSVVGIPFLTQMGLAAAATVVLAVLVALTLVPALLGFLGTRVLPKRERTTRAEPRSENRFFARWADVVARRRVLSLVGVLVVLGVLAAPALRLQTSIGSEGDDAPGSSSREAYDLVAENFGPGANGPLVLLATGPGAGDQVSELGEQVEALPGVIPGVAVFALRSEDAALLTVTPTTGPTDEATADLVRLIREEVQIDGLEIAVTGPTAVGIDVDAQLGDALGLYLVVVVGLALVLLLVLFRSILVPVLAVAGFLLSLGVSLGVTTGVYQLGWLSSVTGVEQPAPLFSLLPIIVVGILFGLAMDYQVFLVSRISEAHARGADPRTAVVDGFKRGAPVVVAAASIMAAVFAGFAGLDDPVIGSIALALTVGVLADAILVRMVLVPAALSLFGRASWWLPRGVGRVLPRLDVEGESLERARSAT